MKYLKQLLLILSCLLSTSVFAQTYRYGTIQHPKGTLEGYIQQRCKRNCVDADVLRMALNAAHKETGVNKRILAAIASVESNFKPKATNRATGLSTGLMQIQVKWHQEKFHGSSPLKHYDVFQNVRAGALVYRGCLKKHGYDQKKALWCYNGHQKKGMSTYVPKVLRELKNIPFYV